MSFSDVVLRELKVELESMRKRRESIDVRINAIELLLAGGQAGRPAAVTAPEPSRRQTFHMLRPGRPRRGSLRVRILQLLDTAALTGREVAAQLESERFRVGGKATLRDRVTHELSRLRRHGILRRDPAGQYSSARTPAAVAQASNDSLAPVDIGQPVSAESV